MAVHCDPSERKQTFNHERDVTMRSDRRIPRVQVDGADRFRTAELVDVETAKRRRIEVQGDEVLPAHVRVAELMYVWNIRAGDRAVTPVASRPVEQSALLVHREHGLPHDARPDAH